MRGSPDPSEHMWILSIALVRVVGRLGNPATSSPRAPRPQGSQHRCCGRKLVPSVADGEREQRRTWRGRRKLADVAGGRCQGSRARGMPGPGLGLLRGVLERSQMSHFSPGIPFIRASMGRGPRKPE